MTYSMWRSPPGVTSSPSHFPIDETAVAAFLSPLRGFVPRHVAIDHSPDAQRIVVLQFLGECGIRESLIADQPREAKDGMTPDGGRTPVRGGWIRTTVNHRMTD